MDKRKATKGKSVVGSSFKTLRTAKSNKETHLISRRQLFRLLAAADHGFNPHWIVELQEHLRDFEEAIIDVQDFRNFLQSPEDGRDLKPQLTEARRRMVAACLKDLMHWNRSWQRFAESFDVDLLYELIGNLNATATLMNKEHAKLSDAIKRHRSAGTPRLGLYSDEG